MRRWLLPEAIEDVLPAEAWQVEVLRRRLLDLLMPDLVDEFTLEIFRRAHADKSQPAIISWPDELLAA